MTFIVKYHIYIDDVKTYKTLNVTFKWYEYVSINRILKRFFKNLNESYPVFSSDIDSINLVF